MVALGVSTVPTGQELLAEFIQYGNQKPFEEIVRRYAGMVFNVCFRITKDKHEAEDATQAVFLTLALQARRGADIKALGPWLQQVAKRLSLDSRRSKKRRKTREERHQVEQTIRRESIIGDTLPSADMDELKTILHEELQKLPAKYRMPLILHYFGGLSRDEMAAELNCKASTLGVRIFRGREMLAGRLSGRGINISLGALAIAMGYAIKRAVSESLIASTSHAATAMMAGYDGSGYASANVIGLTRRATSALAFGKVRITAITLMMAATSLGAGAKAMGILPQINVQRIITNQLNRLMRPLLAPLSRPMRVEAPTPPANTTTTTLTASAADLTTPLAVSPPSHTSSAIPPEVASLMAPITTSNSIVVNFANSPLQSVFTKPAVLTSRWLDDPTSSTASVASDRSGSGSSSAAVGDPADPATTPTSSDSDSMPSSIGTMSGHVADTSPTRMPLPNSGISNVTLSSNDLFVGAGASSGSGSVRSSGHSSLALYGSANASPASQIAVIQVPAIGGTVTETSTGVLSGYGKITLTGTFYNNGQVVATGGPGGVDHTLDLTTFSSILTGTATASTASTLASTTPISKTTAPPLPTQSPNSSTGTTTNGHSFNTEGWYAIDHGRLSMSLYSGSNPSVLTWGENPNDAALGLVNSVRLDLSCSSWIAGSPNVIRPTSLSLLASDRDDAPDLSQLDGVAIGLWQVDPSFGTLSGADITVCYDAALANELGASSASIDLWTLGPDSTWQPVRASSLVLDTDDSSVSGYGSDVSYFAVTAIPAAGTDVSQLIAEHLSEVGNQPTPSIGYGSPSVVPEPTTLFPLFAAGAALLGRRRRTKR